MYIFQYIPKKLMIKKGTLKFEILILVPMKIQVFWYYNEEYWYFVRRYQQLISSAKNRLESEHTVISRQRSQIIFPANYYDDCLLVKIMVSKPSPGPRIFTFLPNQKRQSFLQFLIIASLALSYVMAEPPIPANLGGYARQPSSQYGVPESLGRLGGFNIPSAQYGAPRASSRIGGGGSLSTQYGAPAASSRFGNGASTQFGGSTAPASRYGVPGVSSRFGGDNSLSTQYGAPRAANRFGSSSTPSTQYGVPGISSRFGGPSSLSPQFGASGASSRFEGTNSVSTQYGAPSASRRFNVPKSQYAPDGGYATSRGRYNAQEDDLAEPANYQYSYEVQDAESGSEFSQEESRQEEHAQGSYRVLLPDGRLQIVEYEADQEGYRPQIRYEDIGAGYQSGPQQRGHEGPY